jgi:hypothetical protein
LATIDRTEASSGSEAPGVAAIGRAEGSVEIDWDEEKEKAYQELVARAGKVAQSTPNA